MDEFETTVKKHKIIIDEKIKEYFFRELNLVKNAQRQLFFDLAKFCMGSGKRYRSVFVLESKKAFQKTKGLTSYDYYLSLIPEIFHNSTLIIDDVMDNSEKRRGRDAYHITQLKRLNEKYPDLEIGGDILKSENARGSVTHTYIDAMILQNRTQKIVQEYGVGLSDAKKYQMDQVIRKLIDSVYYGQKLDEELGKKPLEDFKLKDYLDMVSLKTASLFGGCVELGAIMGNAKPHQINQIKQYAINAGIAFQIRDDILDNYPESKENNAHNDIITKKRTVLLAIAYNEGSESQKKKLNNLFSKPITEKSIQSIYDLYVQTGAEERAKGLAAMYVNDAISCLDPKLPNYQFFETFAKEMIFRKK